MGIKIGAGSVMLPANINKVYIGATQYYPDAVATADYGYLYNWYVANDVNFAPTDWKVPSETELNTLITEIGGVSVAGSHLKETGLVHWDSPNTGADNSSGFAALGTGIRASNGEFGQFKEKTGIWSITPFDAIDAKALTLSYNSTFGAVGNSLKYLGYSIRLLYTGAGAPSTMTDYDGNIYNVVLIGSQRWTVQNWKCTSLNNGTLIPTVTDNTAWSTQVSYAKCAYNNDEGNV